MIFSQPDFCFFFFGQWLTTTHYTKITTHALSLSLSLSLSLAAKGEGGGGIEKHTPPSPRPPFAPPSLPHPLNAASATRTRPPNPGPAKKSHAAADAASRLRWRGDQRWVGR